ncbi:uncharacterized protein LOC26535325 isoform X2 [Drosophila yakuba]|uniref:uncharacterized protein LOC26535325 isoform X2 n=1 Tax=Drosophila yakuba TaxID=7245 RepID=UPI00193074B1|nr:uncharacterized protein LOC26535325 isoform X2 [Drosophila yakuba]
MNRFWLTTAGLYVPRSELRRSHYADLEGGGGEGAGVWKLGEPKGKNSIKGSAHDVQSTSESCGKCMRQVLQCPILRGNSDGVRTAVGGQTSNGPLLSACALHLPKATDNISECTRSTTATFTAATSCRKKTK